MKDYSGTSLGNHSNRLLNWSVWCHLDRLTKTGTMVTRKGFLLSSFAISHYEKLMFSAYKHLWDASDCVNVQLVCVAHWLFMYSARLDGYLERHFYNNKFKFKFVFQCLLVTYACSYACKYVCFAYRLKIFKCLWHVFVWFDLDNWPSWIVFFSRMWMSAYTHPGSSVNHTLVIEVAE